MRCLVDALLNVNTLSAKPHGVPSPPPGRSPWGGHIKPRPHQQHVEATCRTATGNMSKQRSTCRQSRPHQLLRQQRLVARSFDMSKEIEHVQFVSTCRKDEKIGQVFRIGTLCYNWPMSAHASQAFSTSTVPIRKIYQKSFDMLPKTATCRTATFDMSKQRSTCCFDMSNSTCCFDMLLV